MRGNSPNITKPVENTIVFIKGHHPDMTAKEIREELMQHHEIYKLDKRQIPSVRSIQNKLKKPKNKENIERIKNDPLNQHWNISLGRKYGISAYIVPILIYIKQIENDRDGLSDDLTIRKARWVEYLYPTLNGLFRRQRPELDSEQRIWRIYIIAQEYVKVEEMYDLKTAGKTPSVSSPDTSNLDNRFLIEEDVSDDSIADIGIHRKLSETDDLLRSIITNKRIQNIKEQPILKAELEPIWGNFAQKAADRYNKYIQKAALELDKQKEHMENEGQIK